jgi:hypothetical protein
VIDLRLNEFVRLHHLDLIRLMNNKVNRFRDHLQGKKLSQQLDGCHLTLEQVRITLGSKH